MNGCGACIDWSFDIELVSKICLHPHRCNKLGLIRRVHGKSDRPIVGLT